MARRSWSSAISHSGVLERRGAWAWHQCDQLADPVAIRPGRQRPAAHAPAARACRAPSPPGPAGSGRGCDRGRTRTNARWDRTIAVLRSCDHEAPPGDGHGPRCAPARSRSQCRPCPRSTRPIVCSWSASGRWPTGSTPSPRRTLERFVVAVSRTIRAAAARHAAARPGPARAERAPAGARGVPRAPRRSLTTPAELLEAKFWEAEALFRLKRFAEARAAYDEVVRTDAASPLAPDALYGFALERARAQAARARRHRASATSSRTWPEHALAPAATLQLARALVELKRVSEALPLLTALRRRSIPSSQAGARRAVPAGLDQGQRPATRAAASPICARSSPPIRTTSRRRPRGGSSAQTLGKYGDRDEQPTAYKTLMEQDPPTAEALYDAARDRQAADHGRRTRRRRGASCRAQFPDHALTRRLALDLADDRLQAKELEGRRRARPSRATQSDDDSVRAEAWLLVGESELKLKRFPQAAKAFEAVGAISDVEAGVRYRALAGLGLAREEQKEWKAALTAYEAVASTQPRLDPARLGARAGDGDEESAAQAGHGTPAPPKRSEPAKPADKPAARRNREAHARARRRLARSRRRHARCRSRRRRPTSRRWCRSPRPRSTSRLCWPTPPLPPAPAELPPLPLAALARAGRATSRWPVDRSRRARCPASGRGPARPRSRSSAGARASSAASTTTPPRRWRARPDRAPSARSCARRATGWRDLLPARPLRAGRLAVPPGRPGAAPGLGRVGAALAAAGRRCALGDAARARDAFTAAAVRPGAGAARPLGAPRPRTRELRARPSRGRPAARGRWCSSARAGAASSRDILFWHGEALGRIGERRRGPRPSSGASSTAGAHPLLPDRAAAPGVVDAGGRARPEALAAFRALPRQPRRPAPSASGARPGCALALLGHRRLGRRARHGGRAQRAALAAGAAAAAAAAAGARSTRPRTADVGPIVQELLAATLTPPMRALGAAGQGRGRPCSGQSRRGAHAVRPGAHEAAGHAAGRAQAAFRLARANFELREFRRRSRPRAARRRAAARPTCASRC